MSMIAYIAGTIQSFSGDRIIVLAGGVGYELSIRSGLTLTKGDDVAFHVYFKMNDTGIKLFGFETLAKKLFFEKLLTVSGVGPKSAMNILSLGSIDEISAAIVRGDVAYLTAVQGMGKKTAERLVVELKSKMKAGEESGAGGQNGEVLGEVIDALVSMGYKKEEARAATKSVSGEGVTTEELLKMVLKNLSR